MAALADLPLKQAYHKPEDDIARAFYLAPADLPGAGCGPRPAG